MLRSSSLLILAAAVSAALATRPAPARAGEIQPETGPTRTVCPDSEARHWPRGGGWRPPSVESAPLELLPGTTQLAVGTTDEETPRLAGPVLWEQTSTFSMAVEGGVLTGTLKQQLVKSEQDGSCDCLYRITLVSGPPGARVTQLRLQGFDHPANGLYGGYRTDLPPAIGKRPSTVRRSGGAGSLVSFDIAGGGVAPGQGTRMIFLDTVAPVVELQPKLRLRANTGELSAPIGTWVPVWPNP